VTYPRIDVDGAIVMVTGGARGIGKAAADLFAAKGATVCVGDLDGAECPPSPRVRGYTVDVTCRDSFAEFVTGALYRHGRIDVLVNNAGVMPLGDFLSEDDAISRTTLDVNLWGLIHGMRLVLPT
jgi:NAD(P)-dependent dehydrogenase (short-subunit alcohol dehydrogenase family)